VVAAPTLALPGSLLRSHMTTCARSRHNVTDDSGFVGCAIAATALGEVCRETMAVMSALGGKPESPIFG